MRTIENIIIEEIELFLSEDKNHGGLDKWFDEEWVDISRKVDGKHPPCGASADKGKRKKDHFKKYPKCVKKSKAKDMTAKEKKDAVKRKRKDVKKDKDKSTPTNTPTDKKKD